MRRNLVFCTLLIFCSLFIASGQDASTNQNSANISCTQRLRLARATYEAGRLHELVGTILGPEAKGCFGEGVNSFSDQEKVDALKLLTLAYIYLEEPLKADEQMLELLRTDHFYKPDDTSDPAEYLALYSSFRTDPIISFGVKVGGTMTMPAITQIYYVGSESAGNGKYKPGYSFIGGMFAEKELFPKSKLGILRNSVVLGEIFFHLRPFRIVNTQLLSNDANGGQSAASYDGKSVSSWMDLNLILRYRILPKHNLDPYIGIGPGISYLLNSKIDLGKMPRTNVNGNITATVTGAAVPVQDAYNTLAQSVTALAGLKFRFGEIYINAEGRYQYGLFNLINPENRTVPGLANDYGMTLNDYRQNNIILNIGVTYPYFKPKKLKRKK